MRDIFLALDVDTNEEALQIAEQVSDFVTGFKIGPRLSMKYGEDLTQKLSLSKPVFIDNKYFDIPNTMLASVRASFDAGASFVTVHAQSGPEALRELALLEAELNNVRPFKLLVVTVLTSFNMETLPINQVKDPIKDQVLALAKQANECGLKGFVCSANEVESLRNTIPDAYLVTPGIRFLNEDPADQKRVVEPKEAFRRGASAIVIGRPICNAIDKVSAAKKYFEASQV